MSKWGYKMHVISSAKIDFLRFWLSTFFLLEELGKMISNITALVCFVYQALFVLTESAKNLC